MVQALLVVVDHRDVDTVLVLLLVTALLETLVVEVPFVVSYLHAQVFGNGIEALVNEHRACDGTENIEAAVKRVTSKGAIERHSMKDETEDYHSSSGEDGIEYHRLEIPL